ncbi:MAG: hypothetical protein M3N95_02835 [Actinomycetota bacterium]|nr:hypothetical protein [Actinomycetota bacterium]
MNDADKKKLHSALGIITNLTAHLSNLAGRSPRAAKYWAEALNKKDSSLDAAQKQKLKNAIAAIEKLTKDAKVVAKDLEACGREASDAALLAKFATAKQFRDTVVAKRLASSKAFDQNAHQFLLSMKGILGSNMYPGMRDADPKVTVDSLANFSSYYNEMRIGLAKL